MVCGLGLREGQCLTAYRVITTTALTRKCISKISAEVTANCVTDFSGAEISPDKLDYFCHWVLGHIYEESNVSVMWEFTVLPLHLGHNAISVDQDLFHLVKYQFRIAATNKYTGWIDTTLKINGLLPYIINALLLTVCWKRKCYWNLALLWNFGSW